MENSQHRKVLVVEDEIFIAEMLKVMLEDMGHEVVALAYNMAAADKAFEEGRFDFAIFDINIEGGMEGLDLARRAQQQEIPFMFLTSYSDRKTVQEAKATKPGAYVIKPFNEEELFAGIEMSLMHASNDELDLVPIKLGHRTVLLRTDDIYFLKAENIYVEVNTKDKRHLVRQSLTGFMESNPRPQLIRVHRSFAVNKNHVTTWSRSMVEVNGHEIPISRSYREQVVNQLS